MSLPKFFHVIALASKCMKVQFSGPLHMLKFVFELFTSIFKLIM